MRKTSISANDGFTLLEVLVAMAILAIVLIAVFRLHAQSISMHSAARFHTTAPLLLQAKLTDLKSTPLAELVADSGNFGEQYPGYTWRFSMADIDDDTLGTVAKRLKKLTVVIAFGDGRYRYETEVYHFFK
ncbi:MAG: prepilin-type N-terminal cleavage/methylation domain-containing protein [Desulfobacterales bacterium]|nr:prepilin-type N-terminal cleavage/methylation domain-containing protein [Desulfobacterales bacterium]